MQEFLQDSQAILFLGVISVLLSSNMILDLLLGQRLMIAKASLISIMGRILISGLLIAFGTFLRPAIASICLFLITIIFFSSEIQQELVPSIFPILHNPLKPKIRNSRSALIINFTNVLGSIHLASTYLAPIFISVWITTSYSRIISNNSEPFATRLFYSIFSGLFYMRALRYTWQNIRKAALDIYIICIIAHLSNSSFDYQTINPPVLFAVAFFRQVTLRFMAKTWFWGLSLFHFLTSKKHVLQWRYVYLILAIIISPLSIALSALLNAPIMPLLGLPIFWMGFLRPKRMWPNIGKSW